MVWHHQQASNTSNHTRAVHNSAPFLKQHLEALSASYIQRAGSLKHLPPSLVTETSRIARATRLTHKVSFPRHIIPWREIYMTHGTLKFGEANRSRLCRLFLLTLFSPMVDKSRCLDNLFAELTLDKHWAVLPIMHVQAFWSKRWVFSSTKRAYEGFIFCLVRLGLRRHAIVRRSSRSAS